MVYVILMLTFDRGVEGHALMVLIYIMEEGA